jgi:glycosyltransferase involved in cell wall biosynthesis
MASVLIDLYMLKYPHCGFGQIAWNYARYFRDQYESQPGLEITLLVPAKYKGAFGDKVKYATASVAKKLFPRLFPKFDVWHSTDQMPRFKPYYADTTYLLTVHDYNHEYEKIGIDLIHARERLNKRIARANHLIYISEFAASDGKRFCQRPELPYSVIYNGVENLTSCSDEVPAGIDPTKPFFFTIGEVRKKKNFHVLLDVMKSFPEYQLYIAGPHPTEYAEQMKKRIVQENISNVHLLGRVDNPHRVWLYRNCKAFLFPSLFEGFGLPPIEAMQFGKPVFMSDKTSLKEIGGSCAYFWTHFEPNYMVEVIRKGLEDFQENPVRKQDCVAYAHSFSYQRNIQQIMDCYVDLLKQKGAL